MYGSSMYESELLIDLNQLDVEWMNQATTFMKYSELAADLKAIADRAKQNLDVVRAELDLEIRADPESFGLLKITESTVSSTIIGEKRYKDAFEKYISDKHDFDIMSAAVRAFDHKKSALENLVKLHGASWFAGPSEPRNIDDVMKEKIDETPKKEVRKKIRRRMNKD